jgi:hypothetical protein
MQVREVAYFLGRFASPCFRKKDFLAHGKSLKSQTNYDEAVTGA